MICWLTQAIEKPGDNHTRLLPATPLFARPRGPRIGRYRGALAQPAWLAKPILFVVSFVPGGTSDIVARQVALKLTKQLGVAVSIDNKANSGGVYAMQKVARAAPDGCTVTLRHGGSLAVNPCIFANTGYYVNRDFMPVTLLAKIPSLFVVHREVLAHAFREFVACVKKESWQAQLCIGW